jgi:hypothetical protein
MTTDELRRLLARVPDPGAVPPIDGELIETSVRYLASDAARRSIDQDLYWPKWDSPWWHMVMLFELGEARRIPAAIAEQMVGALRALPIQVFPTRPEDVPPGMDISRHSTCHCALGCMHQVLTACGVEVGAALPWVEPWFPRYQMADGGLSCDWDAYGIDEVASSMVGTAAAFEAMLARPSEPFVERAARFLIERKLILGSPSRHNAEEREAAARWLLPCFPRFYFYDVQRGLTALVRWAERADGALPIDAVGGVVAHLAATFPDGVIRLQRKSYAGIPTLAQVDGDWKRKQPASTFPLLDAASELGRACAVLTGQWAEARRGLHGLLDAGRVAS